MVRATLADPPQLGIGIGVEDDRAPTRSARERDRSAACLRQSRTTWQACSSGDRTRLSRPPWSVPPSPMRRGCSGAASTSRLEPGTHRSAGNVTVRACLVEQNHDTGVLVLGSDATIEASVVRDTASLSDATFGDGICVESGTVESRPRGHAQRSRWCLQLRWARDHRQGVTLSTSIGRKNGVMPSFNGSHGEGAARRRRNAPRSAIATPRPRVSGLRRRLQPQSQWCRDGRFVPP